MLVFTHYLTPQQTLAPVNVNLMLNAPTVIIITRKIPLAVSSVFSQTQVSYEAINTPFVFIRDAMAAERSTLIGFMDNVPRVVDV